MRAIDSLLGSLLQQGGDELRLVSDSRPQMFHGDVELPLTNLIREHRTAQLVSALQAGGGEGMLVLERHLADLVRAGRIQREVALATATDAGTLADYLRGAG